jgi:hypothetical protein
MGKLSLAWGRIAAPLFLLVFLTSSLIAQTYTGILTWHNDNSRTGQNSTETILTTQNVSGGSFGRLFAYPVDGQMYAQPLYVLGVNIPGRGTRNVVYVATENDSLYAFDAGGQSTTPLWQDSFIDPGNGITPVPCAENAQSCNVYPQIGITGTPVIDPNSGIMYLVTQTKENGSYFHRLHAIDITSGAEMLGGPVVISGFVTGRGAGSKNGKVYFDPQHTVQKPALLLSNNTVYIGWTGNAHGWLMAYNAQTLVQTAIFNSTPNSVLGGIWQSGAGIAGDSNGNIYASTGDATFDINNNGTDYGDTVMQLNNSLQVLDYFTPMDQSCRKSLDLDFAGGGPMLLPPQSGSPVANEIVMAGKGGDDGSGNICNGETSAPIYLLDRDNMGHYNPNMDQDVETVFGAQYGYHSSPAYFGGTSANYIYYGGLISEAGTGEPMKQWTLTNGLLSSNPTAQTQNVFVIGATPSVSSDAGANGIVWAMERQDILSSTPGNNPGILYAYDATNIATTLYSSSNASSYRDEAASGNKFVTPTVASGKVYVGTQTELEVYGLLGKQTASSTAVTSSVNPSYYGQPVTFTATVTVGGNPAPGTVTFKNGHTVIGSATLNGSGVATFTTSTLLPNSHTVAATYNGTGQLAISFATLTQKVSKAPTTTAITGAVPNPSTFGQSVTFTAQVTPSPGAPAPTGTVTFKRGSGVLGTGTLSGGIAQYTTSSTQLPGGNLSIVASYGGDKYSNPSNSQPFTQVVNRAATSTAFTTNPNPSSVGQQVTLTATVSAGAGLPTPTGNVGFKDGNTLIGTVPLSNGVAVLNWTFTTQGTHNLKATYQGSTNYLTSFGTVVQTVQ